MPLDRIVKGDRIIWIIAILMAIISVVAVFTSGVTGLASSSELAAHVSVYRKQFLIAALGIALMFGISLIKIRCIRILTPLLFAVSLLMLFMLLFTKFGEVRNDAGRALKIGILPTIQVYELLKVTLVLFIAWALEKFDGKIETFKDFCIKILGWVALVCVMVMAGRVSSAILLWGISFLMMILMNVRGKNILFTILIAVAAMMLLIAGYTIDHSIQVRKAAKAGLDTEKVEAKVKLFNRFGTVINRFKRHGETLDLSTLSPKELRAYNDMHMQADNAKIAIVEGKIFGKGIGRGTHKYNLPLAYSDFIYASIIEETGIIGGTFIIILYLIFLYRCIALSKDCNTIFSRAVVLGFGFLITSQAFLNMAVNVGLFPITGQTHHMISHGGNAYLCFCIAIGIVLSVSRTVQIRKAQEDAESLIVEEDEKSGQTDVNEQIDFESNE